MPSNKPRLHLAIYARPKHPNSPHYALVVAPKLHRLAGSTNHELQPALSGVPATKFHVKNTLQEVNGQLVQSWRFEQAFLPDFFLDPRLLACFVIGKIRHKHIVEVELLISGVRVYQVDDQDQSKAQNFDCRSWVEDVLGELRGSGYVSGLPADWKVVEKMTLEYVEAKRANGRWDAGRSGNLVPIVDLLTGSELVP